MSDPLDFYPRDRRDDQLSAARGIGLTVFASSALLLFVFGAAFAATDSEEIGAWCMVGACVSSVLTLIMGYNNASR